MDILDDAVLRSHLLLSVPRSRRRRRRVLTDRETVYHVMSRMVRKQFWLGERERGVFVRMMRKQAAFAGVEILTYCMMGNHFHLLIRVPECPLRREGEHRISDAEMVRRYEAFYGKQRPVSTYSVLELKAALAIGGAVAEQARRTVLARMGDLSAFMKELKQRFGIWFNHEHESRGTIWEERFKSVLVENVPEVLTQVAAYIDLNPLRAGMVEDPKDYRWSGYGSAVAGSSLAREGLAGLFPFSGNGLEECLKHYRLFLYAHAGLGSHGGNSAAQAGQTPLEGPVCADFAVGNLRRRISEFSDSIVLGRSGFVGTCVGALANGRGVKLRCWSGWQVISRMLRE